MTGSAAKMIPVPDSWRISTADVIYETFVWQSTELRQLHRATSVTAGPPQLSLNKIQICAAVRVPRARSLRELSRGRVSESRQINPLLR
jgi:hypothetical protein